MIVFLLGLIDSIIGAAAILQGYGIFSKTLVWISSVYLAMKGLMFLGAAGGVELASLTDMAVAILLLAALFFKLPLIVFWLIGLYLIQKGLFSFF
jgi:hypothetical protein